MSAANKVHRSNEIESVWQLYKKTGEISYRNELLEYYLDRTKSLAGKIYASRISNIADYTDYLHYGLLGLISSIDKFDASYGAQFFTFASYRIKGSIIDGISAMEEKTASVSNELIFKSRLKSINDHYVEGDDLFDNLVETSVMLALGIMLENDEVDSDQYNSQAFVELKSVIHNYVHLLDKTERTIIQYHYFHQFSFVSISEILDISRSRVAQLHKKALSELRDKCSSSIELEF